MVKERDECRIDDEARERNSSCESPIVSKIDNLMFVIQELESFLLTNEKAHREEVERLVKGVHDERDVMEAARDALQADLNMQCCERDAVVQERNELELERDALRKELEQERADGFREVSIAVDERNALRSALVELIQFARHRSPNLNEACDKAEAALRKVSNAPK